MSNSLKETMNKYSDQRIVNHIKQQNHFTPEAIKVAKEIAIERGILSIEKIQSMTEELQKELAQKSSLPFQPKSVLAKIGAGAALYTIIILLKWIFRMTQNS